MNASGTMRVLVGTLVLSAFLAGTSSAAEERVVFNKDGSLDRPVGFADGSMSDQRSYQKVPSISSRTSLYQRMKS